jgi:tetratricopeptide (TPR) repeat protein
MMRRARGLPLCCGALALLLAAGCSKHPRGVQTEPSALPPSGTTLAHTVGPGDTWQSIAETYLGTPEPAARLARDNGRAIDSAPAPGDTVRVRILAAEMPRVRQLAEAREPYNTGFQHLNAGRYKEAAASFQEALHRAPGFVDAQYNLGLALLRLQKAGDAVAPLREVVAVRPADKDARYALASAYFHLGRYADSLPELEAALGLDAAFLRARFTHGMVLEKLGESERARLAWQKYLELDGTSAWAQEARSHLRALP